MTGANIRHHLALMKADGQIVILSQQQGVRGRPINIYGASDRVRGTGLRGLVEAMLDTWTGNMPGDELDSHLRSLAKNLAGAATMDANVGTSRRLGQAVDRLNDLHYQARWEAGASGAKVILSHCPYAEIIERHPELCRMEAYMLEDKTGLHARQLAKQEQGRDGVRRCIFGVD